MSVRIAAVARADPPRRRTANFAFTVLLVLGIAPACSELSGPATAVSLNLHAVNGVVVPAALPRPDGVMVTIGGGRMQGNNWGHACGVALRLAEGPLTAVEIPDCRLKPGEERRVNIVIEDSRFPRGPHEYRFVP